MLGHHKRWTSIVLLLLHLDGGDRGVIRINPARPSDSDCGVIALKSFEKIPPGDKSSVEERRRGLLSDWNREGAKAGGRPTAKAKEPTRQHLISFRGRNVLGPTQSHSTQILIWWQRANVDACCTWGGAFLTENRGDRTAPSQINFPPKCTTDGRRRSADATPPSERTPSILSPSLCLLAHPIRRRRDSN